MRVLNFGSCNIDYVYQLDHMVTEGETERSDSMAIFAGGKGLNQSIAAARAGIKICHAGYIGADGDFLLDALTKDGVDTTFVRRVAEKNGHAIIQVNRFGENAIVVHPGTNAMLDEPYVDDVLSHFSAGDLVILQNETNLLPYIIRQAYQRKMAILLNPSPINQALQNVPLSMLSYLVLNEIEAASLFHGKDTDTCLTNAAAQYPTLRIVLTRGKQGAIYWDEDGTLYQHAFLVDAVDTTAAGDTFTGYFVSGLARDISIQANLRTASAASAIAVSRHGASPSIPTMDEVTRQIGHMQAIACSFDAPN